MGACADAAAAERCESFLVAVVSDEIVVLSS